MPEFDFDLFVIGGGSGGVRAARVAAERGKRVAIAEEYRYGGTCVIRGCVPKKILVYASEYGYAITDSKGYGWSCDQVSFDWPALIANKDEEITRLSSIYQRRLAQAGVEVLHERAVLTDPHTIEVGGQRVTAAIILIATGGRPRPLEVPGAEHVVTSNEVFHLPALPGHVTVVGGGYIGIEFSHIFAGVGVQTALVHHRHEVLRGFDHDIRAAATDGLRDHGIELYLNDEVSGVDRLDSGGLRVHLRSGGAFQTDLLMSAVGRVPSTAGMGLEAAGVALGDNGQVIVDEYSRTSIDHIYAIGDCTDRINLTPVAIREAQAFVDSILGDRPVALDHSCIPTAVFGQPPVAAVGLTEEQARERYPRLDIYKSRFVPLKHTLTGRAQRTMMKLVVDADSQRVLGAHMVGMDAAEIIQCVAIAVHMGATKADFDATVALHPTTAEEFVLMRQKSE
jgi:glutathione reductase (NADPH)